MVHRLPGIQLHEDACMFHGRRNHVLSHDRAGKYRKTYVHRPKAALFKLFIWFSSESRCDDL